MGLGMYGAAVRNPVIGSVVRLPVRAFRAAVWPAIQVEIARCRTEIQQEIARSARGDLPGLWDATASLQAQIQGLCHRVEFVRAETMFEMRAMMVGGRREVGYATKIDAKIKNREKVDAALSAETLRLNVGCGHIPLDGYINCDARDLPGIDVVADATQLPFEPGNVAEIFSSHLLEHVPLEHFKRVLLPHWKALLRPSGYFHSVVPDAEGMIADYVAGRMSFDDLREVTYGLQEYEGDFHFNMFARDMLKNLLIEAGFEDVRFEFVNRKNGKCRDMEIRGMRQ